MKKILLALALTATAATQCLAQAVEGAMYYLPKTELRFSLLIEKTKYTPGEFAMYSERFLKKAAPTDASETYRLIGINMYTTAVPDSSKQFVLPMDKKHTIFNTAITDGILTAINAKGRKTEMPAEFTPAPKAAPVNPHDFMNEDILKAASTAKMAELTARDIYDIRTSRSELTRGEADYMPKDGEQLRIMLANLDRQEQILTQTFMGVNDIDTLETTITFVPDAEGKQMLFRFSKRLGLVDNDDLSGVPYYINIEDLHILPEVKTEADGMKPSKDPGITINNPGKIKVTLSENTHGVKSFETYAAQFGELTVLSSNLFGKKFTTHVQLNPVTGNVESMEVEPLE